MKVVFLDRDGTVINDPEDLRVKTESDLMLFSDTIEALKMLADNGFAVVMITNQAGIAEGLLTADDFTRINNVCVEMLKPSGVQILKTYMCPHGEADVCDCRKPKPKMILDAATEFGVDLGSAFMVGDRPSDIAAGLAAGTKTIFVETANTPASAPDADFTAPTLLDAVKYVIANS
jgi:D-glycero-D-manno-heptose 1,7-bisphosphate phosphatase